MTKDEAERMAKRKTAAKDGWKYEAGKHPNLKDAFAVFRMRKDASAKELYRTNNS